MAEGAELEEAKFEKWNELPPEIKTECIQKLDIKTRCNLRNTSKTERELVYRQKFEIDEVVLDIRNMQNMTVRLIEKGSIRKLNIDIPTHIPLIKFILQCGVFEKLQATSSISIDELTELFPETEFISAKNFVNFSNREEFCLFWIEKVKNRLESVIIMNFDRETTPGLLSSHEKIVDAHRFHLCSHYLVENVSNLAQYWIYDDAEIGKKFLGLKNDSFNFEELKYFGDMFSDRIISQTERMIRVRMDNEEKHILVGVGGYGKLRMTVIPSKLKESEYSNSEGFIRDLVESVEDEPYSVYDEDSDDDFENSDDYSDNDELDE